MKPARRLAFRVRLNRLRVERGQPPEPLFAPPCRGPACARPPVETLPDPLEVMQRYIGSGGDDPRTLEAIERTVAHVDALGLAPRTPREHALWAHQVAETYLYIAAGDFGDARDWPEARRSLERLHREEWSELAR